MKTPMIVVVMSLSLFGCMTIEQKQKSFDDYTASVKVMKEAEGHRVYVCDDRNSCEKAFRLAKIYVQENSDMRVQHSDDSMISTYGPTRKHAIGLKATLTPDKGDKSIIRLSGECKNDPAQYLDPFCPVYLARRYEGFRAFIESKMN